MFLGRLDSGFGMNMNLGGAFSRICENLYIHVSVLSRGYAQVAKLASHGREISVEIGSHP